MEKLIYYIQQAEQKMLDPLYKFCRSKFADNKIPSHNHSHHLRVWEYAKEILYALNYSSEVNYNMVESCIIASLFHDTGFTKTTDENHGKESREICVKYFNDNNFKKPENFEEILYAIEKHDDKEYKLKGIPFNSVFSVLCNADDLDAFGNIGVIRYTEIYLLRGIHFNELPNLVISNLDKRFANFKKNYRHCDDLYVKHKSRYLTTRIFFENLLKEF